MENPDFHSHCVAQKIMVIPLACESKINKQEDRRTEWEREKTDQVNQKTKIR